MGLIAGMFSFPLRHDQKLAGHLLLLHCKYGFMGSVGDWQMVGAAFYKVDIWLLSE